jgi:serine/threonine protein kinase
LKDVETTIKFVKKWKDLRGHRIQGFLGASTVDNPPFIVAGPCHLNIVEYAKATARPNYRRLVHEIVRALEYLHTRVPPVIHGRLRPATIDVDEKGNVAVGSVGLQLDDMRVPPDERPKIEQMLKRWTAPEVLEGMPPTVESDIYALGVIVSDLIATAQERNPSRKLSLLSSIKEQCTAPDPFVRPTLQALVKQLEKRSEDPDTDLLVTMPSTDKITELTGLQNIDRWRIVPYVCKIHTAFTEHVDHLYVASTPLQGMEEHPLRQLAIEVKCHDQGRENTSRLLNTRVLGHG